jgi:carbamoyltransferase
MITWGISANSHDAALAVFVDDKLKFASHSERFSRKKNDPDLCDALVNYAASSYGEPDTVVWYENPWLKTTRQLFAGQGFQDNNVKNYLKKWHIDAKIHYVTHHKSHAAAGFYTSKFDNATVLVIDSIGEWDCITVWKACTQSGLTKIYSQKYPHSIGLWYSAMTQRLELTPNEDEYILMGMAAHGNPNKYFDRINNDFFKSNFYSWPKLKRNLHKGCLDWLPNLPKEEYFDVAAGVQEVYKYQLKEILRQVRVLAPNENLVFMGGCALNCSANHILFDYFKNVWIMPNPGDAGSAIGSVLAYNKKHIEWPGPFLGYEIAPKATDKEIVSYLLKNKICGVARGPAEFGPRALGNRSLIADPRHKDTKEIVNRIKQREEFRPFAPMVLKEYAKDFFDMPVDSSPYMQFTAKCKFPNEFPAIVHVDDTSRVQTVDESAPLARKLLEAWYKETGCPMLLNTSLNMKGQPMVNDIIDSLEFQEKHNMKVFN